MFYLIHKTMFFIENGKCKLYMNETRSNPIFMQLKKTEFRMCWKKEKYVGKRRKTFLNCINILK